MKLFVYVGFVSKALCLSWFCNQNSWFMFVYVGFVNKALRFCLFMLVLNFMLFGSVVLCWFCIRSSLFLFVNVALVNKALLFSLFMSNKAKNEATLVLSLCIC